ncbi:MAG: hypothetical protein ACE37D_10660 [Pseudomonadales bacterium]
MRLGLLITLAVICQISLAADYPTIYLNGSWKFHPGDDLAWAQPDFDDGNWQALPLPGTWEDASDANSAWYRRTINISQFPRQDLGLQIGAIRNAYEVYVDGERLGAVGKLPPDPEINYDLLRVYRVPPDLTAGKDSMVIALRVWGGSDLSIGVTGAGPYSGTFALGNYTPGARIRCGTSSAPDFRQHVLVGRRLFLVFAPPYQGDSCFLLVWLHFSGAGAVYRYPDPVEVRLGT